MTKNLLVRGMVAGLFAALLTTLFARWFAEPQIDLALVYEAAGHGGTMAHPMAPEIVSRATQKGFGLLVAIALYGTAIGGIFSLVFAAALGRIGPAAPRPLALLLALLGFVTVALVPGLAYPATPPAVGQHETVAFRTLCYFAMIAASLGALTLGLWVARRARARFGGFDARLAGGAAWLAAVILAMLSLPAINEVPATFPAVLLWKFRIASLAMQAVLWISLGLAFGGLAETRLRQPG